MTASFRRFFLGSPPFEYLTAHLAQDPEFLEDARTILGLDEDAYLRLATQLAKADNFLNRTDVARIVGESLGGDSERIAAIIYRAAGIIHDSGMDANDAMDQFSKAIEDKADGLELHQRREFADRIRKLVAEPSGIAKQFKARQLVDAIGAELDEFRIICDIRPIFDKSRQRLDGAVPISVFRLEYTNSDGEPSVAELRVTEKQISQLVEKLSDAKLKLTMIKDFLTSQRLAIPKTKATFSEDE